MLSAVSRDTLLKAVDATNNCPTGCPKGVPGGTMHDLDALRIRILSNTDVLESTEMKPSIFLTICLFSAAVGIAQNEGQKIFETEKAFERQVAEKGIRSGFIEFLSPVGIMFMPDAVNGREAWTARPASDAALTWNPIWIDWSANSVLAYSIGNSRYRAQGKDDPTIFYGHYLSIWLRQAGGQYRAALDAGINHEKPRSEPTAWRSPIDSGKGSNPDKLSAGDSAVGFYQMAAASDTAKAYQRYLADDAILMRDGKEPAFGKRAALDQLKGNYKINFGKRKSFTEAIDLAYVNSPYYITDKKGTETERGNFVQVWKLRRSRWLIVADILVPIPKK